MTSIIRILNEKFRNNPYVVFYNFIPTANTEREENKFMLEGTNGWEQKGFKTLDSAKRYAISKLKSRKNSKTGSKTKLSEFYNSSAVIINLNNGNRWIWMGIKNGFVRD